MLFANPDPRCVSHHHDADYCAFGQYAFVTAFDTKGGFANVNVGIISVQNASVGGPVHELFVGRSGAPTLD